MNTFHSAGKHPAAWLCLKLSHPGQASVEEQGGDNLWRTVSRCTCHQPHKAPNHWCIHLWLDDVEHPSGAEQPKPGAHSPCPVRLAPQLSSHHHRAHALPGKRREDRVSAKQSPAS